MELFCENGQKLQVIITNITGILYALKSILWLIIENLRAEISFEISLLTIPAS